MSDVVRYLFLMVRLFILLILFLALPAHAEKIERFEYFDTDAGLSQNTVTSIHCDTRGFLWVGTMNGLNRFDGYQFKIYQNTPEQPEMLTNNRVISIWEDEQEFLWFETYDGYYHYMNPRAEAFATLPNYQLSLEEKYSKINCFYQHTSDEVWLGSSNSGVYRLRYDSVRDDYVSSQFLSRGQFAISNNDIRFIVADRDSNLYFGTRNGLNVLKNKNKRAENFYFEHFFPEMNFTSAIAINNEVWLATSNSGIVIYNLETRSFYVLNKNNSPLDCNNIDLLKVSSKGNILVGSAGLYIYQPETKNWLQVEVDGERIDKIFEDSEAVLWVTNGKFGVKQVNQFTGTSRHFDLTPPDYRYLSDRERPYFYEDRNKQLWICIHGGGLAQYQRANDYFVFHRNNPSDPKSISSNTVMCMTEDKNGTLWVGTGLQGGLNKVIFQNPAFKSVQFDAHYDDFMENIVRALMEDENGNIWVASKGGKIKIYDKNINEITPPLSYPFTPEGGLVYNVYAIFQDSRGYIWLGSKGAGIAVSTQPASHSNSYRNIRFHRYQNNPTDSSTLVNDNIYCFDEDAHGNIWIGTYGGGLSFTNAEDVSRLKFQSVNTANSNLSNDMIRDIEFDSNNNLWVASTFGLNKLSGDIHPDSAYVFEGFYRDPENENSLSYNDVVHIFEDSRQQLWFGTFGGGLNKLNGIGTFKSYTSIDGLCNNDVFGITEDQQGYIWLSTENGLSRFDPMNEFFENYNKSNSLGSDNFSENTCLHTADGKLFFGSSKGFEVVMPEKIVNKEYISHLTFTNFQLFNKDVDVHSPGSPLLQSISYTEKIELAHNQSSFSIEFSAMNFLDDSKTQFAYLLENFDDEWNYIGSERKATYTNLKPGDYLFKVKSALWNGNWDSEAASIQIKINPPWWQTNNAYIIYLIVFVVGTFLVSRAVIRMSSIRNQLKVEKAVNEVKLQFFTNISHEIRTPLTLILGPIEDVLSDSSFPDRYRPTLYMMQKNGKRMLHLLNQLLEFRKAQNRKMTLKVAPVDIVEFTKGIYDNFVPHAQYKQINFSFNAKAHPENVWADPYRIDSVIFNILSNAFKFTPPGNSVQISIDQNTDKNEVYIKVLDGGPGISSKDIPLIFNRYTILSDDKNPNAGTGIGLNLSNEIVKLHGGEIRVENHPGKGCEFCVVLKAGVEHLHDQQNVLFIDEGPAKKEKERSMLDAFPVSETETVINLKQNTSGPLVLVVEDNLQILKYISEALAADFSIVTATNGKEGLEEAAKHGPELIISDVMMPVINGIEMTRQLKENFETCHIPVILLTAKSGIDDQILGIDSGAEAYVLKPFNVAVLKSMMQNMLAQRKLILNKYHGKAEVEVADIKINSRNQEFLDKVIKYIEDNYSDPQLSITSLVEYSCVSRTVFYNKIKSLTGLSPIELMRQIKLKIAAQMLENGYNVNETAFKIGFNDTRYFSKQFKELYGESPSSYKKRLQTSEEA